MDTGAQHLRYHIRHRRRIVRRLSVTPQCQAADPDAVLRREAGAVSELDDHFVRTYKNIFTSPKFMLSSLYQSYHIFHNISNQSLDNN